MKRTANDELAKYISSRMRTEFEAKNHLADKGYSQDEISVAISEFKENKYIDDYEYALSYCEYAISKKRAKARIKREMKEKGIPNDVASNAFDDYIAENFYDELRTARKIAIFELEQCGNVADKRTLDRIGRKLERLGYSYEDIINVLDDMRREE